MRDFRSTLSVDAIGDAFAVVRIEQWRHDHPPAIATIMRNKVMADGPFECRADAEAALVRINGKSR